MKISLYQWANLRDVEVGDLTKDTQVTPLDYKVPLPDGEITRRKKAADNEDENLIAKIKELDAVINIGDFEIILNGKLEKEYDIFYSAVQSPASSSAVQGGGGMEPDYIKKLLDKYYANVIITHYQELVDAYLYSTQDVEKNRITDKMGRIYNYILDLYPDNVYHYLYSGFKPAPLYIKNQLEEPVEEKAYLEEALPESPHESALPHESAGPVFARLRSPSPFPPNIKQNPSWVEIAAKKRRGRLRRTPSATPSRRSETPMVYEETPRPSYIGHLSFPTPPPEKGDIGTHGKRGESGKLRRVDTLVKKGYLSDIEERESSRSRKIRVEGGKATRKYKNKRNKKTRQHRKKTRKNRTLKKKKGKGKRTRRY